MEGFEPKKPTLKQGTVPTVFCFSHSTKCRKLNEARESRGLHHSNIEDLSAGPSTEPQSIMEPEPATRDVGVQCG